MKTRIVSAFPGTGKSYLAKKYPDQVADLDSSRFSWTDFYIDGVRQRNPDFPYNYISHIQNLIEKKQYKIVFVSSHKDVRDSLREYDIYFTLVYPRIQDKLKYIQRYLERGNTEDFVKTVEKNWKGWILTLQSEVDGCENIELQSDYLDKLFEDELI